MRTGASGSRSTGLAAALAAALAVILLQPVLPQRSAPSREPVVGSASEAPGAAGSHDGPFSRGDGGAPCDDEGPAEDAADDDGDELDALHTHLLLAWSPPIATKSDELSHADTHRPGHRDQLDRPPRA